MSQVVVKRFTCDRCGLTDDDPHPEQWRAVLLPPTARPLDFCPDCWRALQAFLERGKGPPKGVAEAAA